MKFENQAPDPVGCDPGGNHGRSMNAEIPSRWFPMLVAALALAPFLPLLAPDDRVFATNEHCDYASFYLPIREFARQEIRRGEFPLWVPWIGCGLPLHASQQAALGYPLLTPLLAIFPANFALRSSLFLHMALCFAGQYFLARTLGAGRTASSLAAIVPTQSGFAIAHLMAGHIHQVFAFALIPWLFLALVRHLRDPSAGSALCLAVVGALLALSGHPQVPYYAVLIGFLWWAGSLIWGIGSLHRMRCIGWTAVAVVIAVSISLIQILPTLELLRDNAGASGRGTIEHAGTFAMDGFDLLHFFMPNLRGNPFVGIPDFPPFYFFHERTGYVGLAALVFSLYALSRSSARLWDWGAAVLILSSLTVAVGTSTPVFGILGQALPGLHLFRCPGRIVSVVTVLAGLLAARGLDAAIKREPRAPRRQIFALLVVIWVIANGAGYLMVQEASGFSWAKYTEFARSYLVGDFVVSLVCAVSVTMALWLCLRFGRAAPTIAASAVVGVALIDLGFFNVANFHLDANPVNEMPKEVIAIEPPIRFAEVRNPGRLPASATRYSKSVPLAIAHHRGMVGTNDGGVLPATTERLFHALEVNTKVALAASACSYEYFPATRSWRWIAGALPRCRFIAEEHAPLARVPIESLSLDDLNSATHSTNVQPRITSETPRAISIDIASPGSGLLVLADTSYPGWRCSIDGTAVQIDVVHGVFRGVHVEAGAHHVQFEYNPNSYRWGWCGSLVGILAAAILGIFSTARRSSRSRRSHGDGISVSADTLT